VKENKMKVKMNGSGSKMNNFRLKVTACGSRDEDWRW
jgi:hypothetical protein